MVLKNDFLGHPVCCAHNTSHYILNTDNCTMQTVHFTLHTAHCNLKTVHFTLHFSGTLLRTEKLPVGQDESASIDIFFSSGIHLVMVEEES